MRILTLPLGPLQTNCFILGDDETKDAVVFDPGDEAPKVLAALQAHGWSLRHILLTHAHFDHIGGVAGVVEATGAPIALHPDERLLLKMRGGAMLFGMSIPACPEPQVWLQPGEPLTIGNLRFDVLFVPGHTPGHVAFYCPAAHAVFSGDVLFYDSIGRTDLPGGHYQTLMRSIRHMLLILPDDTQVCCGHGPVTTLGRERRENPFLAE
jgi:glyoxylase-like metal-dependent hydrolase (beta-lactamase superfamily II)